MKPKICWAQHTFACAVATYLMGSPHSCSRLWANAMLGTLLYLFRGNTLPRHHYRPAVNCLVNYSALVIKPDLYITGSGDCVCLVNLIKQQVQNQVIWLWCAPCENDNQTKILIWAALTYFCMWRTTCLVRGRASTITLDCVKKKIPKLKRIQISHHL